MVSNTAAKGITFYEDLLQRFQLTGALLKQYNINCRNANQGKYCINCNNCSYLHFICCSCTIFMSQLFSCQSTNLYVSIDYIMSCLIYIHVLYNIMLLYEGKGYSYFSNKMILLNSYGTSFISKVGAS